MYRVHAIGQKDEIERAWSALAWTDPSPASAVDYREEGRHVWRLDAYAESAEAAVACQLLAAKTAPDLVLRTEPVEDRDWIALSLEGLPPVRAGRFTIVGAHNRSTVRGGKLGLCIEAGPAFGTGHHGTTLGCLMAYNRLRRWHRPSRVLDLGTGTGVLAIAALKDGASRAIATDIDHGSVDVTRENARKNGVSRRIRVLQATGTCSVSVRRSAPYDLVFANILNRPLIRLAPSLAPLTRRGGHLILSGLLAHQAPLVTAAYTGQGLVPVSRIRKDGWVTLVFRRPGPSQGG